MCRDADADADADAEPSSAPRSHGIDHSVAESVLFSCRSELQPELIGDPQDGVPELGGGGMAVRPGGFPYEGPE
jgi:hypothetical protein